MGKINVKDGTPLGWATLCTTCSWAHVVTGYRQSELLVVCTDTNPNITVPFKVQACSCYLDKNRPNYDQMEKLAIDILPLSSAKPVGFRPKIAAVRNEDAEVAEQVGWLGT
jgi:hypothetical protein